MLGVNVIRIDRLSRRAKAEVAVNGAVTATLDRRHVCVDAGSPADYTITLPAASASSGRFVSIAVSLAMTKLVTIDANSTELIDGDQTRVLWAGESCELYCNGSAWFKLGGVFRAMECELCINADQTGVTTGTVVPVQFNTTILDNVGTMADLANDRIVIRRAGRYEFDAQIRLGALTTTSPRNIGLVTKGGNQLAAFEASNATSGTNPSLPFSFKYDCAVGDLIKLEGFQNSGANASFLGDNSSPRIKYTFLNVRELQAW